MSKTRNASVLLEILISMVILFMTILVVTASIKRLMLVQTQKENYENLYVTLFSLLDTVSEKGCSRMKRSGNLNGFIYSMHCDEMAQTMTKDKNGVTLNKIKIQLNQDGMEKTYVYYKTSAPVNTNDAR